MKKCIECGRNNGKVKMVFVGAGCEDCANRVVYSVKKLEKKCRNNCVLV